jgi:hypothetical protein
MSDWYKNSDVPKKLIKGLIALSGIYDFNSLIKFPKCETQETLKLTANEAKRFSPFYHLP